MSATPSLDDDTHEALIELAALRLQSARTVPQRRSAWAELQSLIAARSPEQVAFMEERRGLRK